MTIVTMITAVVVGALKMVRALFGATDPVRVTKVLAINESQGIGESYSEAFRPDLGLELVQAQIPWQKYRIEVRYEFNGEKYRIVYRPDDVMEYPPRKAFGFVRAPHLVKAVCVSNDGDDYDVTKRVRKYLGPERNFHSSKGVRLHLWDMFPFDDHEFEAEYLSHLRLDFSDGTVALFEYGINPRIVA